MHQKRSSSSLEKAIFKTLSYSDIFEYPLTTDQLYRFLGKKVKGKTFLSSLMDIPHLRRGNMVYYFLPKREHIVEKRLQKEKYSQKDLQKTKKIAHLLSFIPSITYIGISGSLALYQASEKSDIDLFFITSSRTVWITRFLVYVFLGILGVRRKRKQSEQICANMFIDENHLSLPIKKRNIYTAHEIVQLFPLINKNNSYEKFVHANRWIKKYLPNTVMPKIRRKKSQESAKIVEFFETLSMKLQLWYMKKNKTREITTPTLIAFHPIDYEHAILGEYTKRIQLL